MRTFSTLRRISAAFLLPFVLLEAASAQNLKGTFVASGFASPTFVTSPPNDASRLFVVEQAGRIRIFTNGQILAPAFLDIDPKVQSGGEQGLLSMAFHPDYANNGRFFVAYTGNGGPIVIEEYVVSANPNVADPSSAVIRYGPYPHPQSNHNGGQLQFGSDGMLYFGHGDGGGAGDTGAGHAPVGNGQYPLTDLGKILRLDVDIPAPHVPASNPFASPTDGTNDLIWAFGVRNPWRFSFDAATGDLYIADVGQGSWEEVDFQPASSAGGENYGWRCMEGAHCTGATGCTCFAANLVLPIQEYSHSFGCSITGGYVYRGGQIPSIEGHYFYADYCSARIWSLKYENGQVTQFTERTAQLDPPGALSIASISSFGEDAAGRLYVVDQSGGEIFRIDANCVEPTNYCVAAPNSVGPGATIGSQGLSSLSAGNFVLTAQGLPPSTLGIFFTGTTQTQVPVANGFRCIGGTVRRLGFTNSDPNGFASQAVDWSQVPGATPGASVFFQMYYRDTAAGGANANFTDGLATTVCP